MVEERHYTYELGTPLNDADHAKSLNAGLAQSGELRILNPQVVGSNPSRRTIYPGLAQQVRARALLGDYLFRK